MRSLAPWLAALLLANLCEAAASPRLLVREPEVQKTPLGQVLRLTAVPLTLQGGLIGDGEWTLEIGSRTLDVPPIVVSRQQRYPREAIVFVVQTTRDYAPLLTRLKRDITPFAEGLADSTEIALLTYDDTVSGGRSFLGGTGFAAEIDDIEAGNESTERSLLEAVNRAISTLAIKREKDPSVSTSIIVLSDGQNEGQVPEEFHDIGQRARKRGIYIHCIGFSPDDFRTPLLGLGTLSKRSRGTFRWLRTVDGLGQMLASLRKEMNESYLLSFFVGKRSLIGKPLYLRRGDLKSARFVVEKVTCGGDETCSQFCLADKCFAPPPAQTPWLQWGLIGGGSVAGLFVLFFGVRLLRRRQPRVAPPGPTTGGHAPVAMAPRGEFIVLAGGPVGQRFAAAHGMILGSGPQCHILLPRLPGIAGQHVRLEAQKGGALAAVDCSGQGFLVNGVATTRKVLSHGTSIQLGAATLRYLEPR